MPKVGQRIIKSALAVYLCFLVCLIRGAGIPFYSAIAAVLCMQPEMGEAYAKAKSRIIATLIGGVIGMLTLYLFQRYLTSDQELLRYTLISLMIIPLIYVTVVWKQPSSAYLTCVVFMCITVSHITDESAFVFGCNRILDTLIGIVIALCINSLHLPHRKHKELLIEVPLSLVKETNGTLDTYTNVHLNRCIKEGARFLFTSYQTPSAVIAQTKKLRTPLECVLMDGVIRYEIGTQTCEALQTIPETVWKAVYQRLGELDIHPFLYQVKDELLYVHFDSMANVYMQAVYQKQKKLAGQHYIQHEQSLDEIIHQDMVMMMVIEKEAKLLEIQKALALDLGVITWIQYPIADEKDLRMLRIYPHTIASQDTSIMIAHALGLSEVYKVRSEQKEKNTKQIIKQIECAFHKGYTEHKKKK